MGISATQVKELRERTGLGMMECKNALVESDGDIDEAIALLRKRAGAKVEKKAGRTAAEGIVATYVSDDQKLAAMVEINCETDFVAKEEGFVDFAATVAKTIAEHDPDDIDALLALSLTDGKADTIGQTREYLVAKLGEKIDVRRFTCYKASNGHLDTYVHAGSRIGVLVEMEGGDNALAHDMAMQVAATRPEYISSDDVPSDIANKEREILIDQAKDSGKPPDIVEKMVAGRLNKYLSELTLLGKPFVKDPDTIVEKLLKSASARIERFCRYEVGEGIEKKAA
jgi:elongation factor Ts